MMPNPKLKTSIRSSATRSRMATPALHSIIVDTHAESAAIREYMRIKKKEGSQAVPLPLLNHSVILELRNKLHSSSDARTSVQCVIVCLEEFSSNSKFTEPWRSLHEEIVHLILCCIGFFSQLRRNDFEHKTSSFDDCVRSFTKLCYVIDYAATENEPFSTLLFKKAAPDFFSLLISKGLSPAVFSMVVRALSSLCHSANKADIADTFKRFSVHLNAIGRRLFHYEVECQVDMYWILHSSLSDLEEAKKMAAVWFNKWPALVDSFIKCFPKAMSQGAGIFTSKVHELKVQATTSSVKPIRHITASESQQATSGPKVKIVGISNVDGQTSSLAQGYDKNRLKGVQTPYYPDRRKCLSLRTAKQSLPAEHPQTIDNYNHDDESKKDKGCSRQTGSHGQPKHLKWEPSEKSDFGNISNFHKVPSAVPPTNTGSRYSVKNRQRLATGTLSIFSSENEECKVEKWLRGSSFEYPSLTEVEDVSDTAQWNPLVNPRTASDNFSGEERKNTSYKHSSSEMPSSSKKRKMAVCQEGRTSPIGHGNNSVTESTYHKETHWGGNSFINQTRACGISKNLHTRPTIEMKTESDDEDAEPKGKGKQKSKRPLFSKVTEEPKEGSVLTDSSLNNVRNQSSCAQANRPRNLWAQKLMELEQKRVMERKLGRDIYQFSANLTYETPAPKFFKKPVDFARKSTSAARSKSKKNSPAKIKSVRKPQANKENKAPRNVGTSISREKKRTEKTSVEVSNQCTRTKLQSKKTSGCYSPIVDDSMEMLKLVKSPNSAVLNFKDVHYAEAGHEAKSASVPMRTRRETGKTGIEEASYQKKAPGRVATSNVIGSKTSMAELECLKSPAAAQIDNAKLKGKFDSLDNTVNYPSPTLKCSVNQSRDVDSGVEITSDTPSHFSNIKGDAHQAPAQRKESALSQFLKANIREYLKNATESNSNLSKNHSEMTSEIVEIKGLAEKIAASADRCQAVGSNQQKIIGGQAASLQKCTKLIDSCAQRQTTSSIVQELKARNTARILEAMKTVIEENYSFCSSDSE